MMTPTSRTGSARPREICAAGMLQGTFLIPRRVRVTRIADSSFAFFAGVCRVGGRMARITIQVLEGFERGRVFGDLPTPVTIGREEDNTIQLNDERVSRFHVKIQEDDGRIILTDLDSTNGTRINGHPVQMRVLQFGDQLSIGRSILLFGSPGEIDGKVEAATPEIDLHGRETREPAAGHRTVSGPADDVGRQVGDEPSSEVGDEVQELFPKGPPEIPVSL